jgi:hypothetical protein
MEATIIMEDGNFIVGEYTIAGSYEDGYTIWRTDEGEDSDALYESNSFEDCIVWCINS